MNKEETQMETEKISPKFKTDEDIDDYFISIGRLTREDIDRIHDEIILMGIALEKSQSDAVKYLKNRMGLIKYLLWKLSRFPFGAYLSYGFGYDGYIEKAKELGWKDTFKYHKYK